MAEYEAMGRAHGRVETEKAMCACLADCIHREVPPPFFVGELVDKIIAGEIPNIRYIDQQEGERDG